MTFRDSTPGFPNWISTGNIIQIVILLVGLGALWAEGTGRIEQLEERANAREQELQLIQERIRVAEQTLARDDERFNSILSFMARIDTRLERLENGRIQPSTPQ